MERFKLPSRPAAFCAAIVLVATANRCLAGWPANGTQLSGPTPVQYFQTGVASDGALLVLFGPNVPSSIARLTTSGAIATGWPVALEGSRGLIDGLAPDLLGGCYYVYVDVDTVLVHHLRADGSADPAWPAHGVLVCNAPGEKRTPFVATEPSGGVYVIWTDGRDAPHQLPIAVFASRLLPDGSVAPGWDPGGTRLATVPDTTTARLAGGTADGLGGLYIVALRSTGIGSLGGERNESFLLHLSPSGPSPGWPAGGFFPPGVPLGNPFGFGRDGAGGVFVDWYVGESSFIQRFDTSAHVASGWPAEGRRAVADTSAGCYTLGFGADGNGGGRFLMIVGPPGDPSHWPWYLGAIDSAGSALPGWPSPGVQLPAEAPAGVSFDTDSSAGSYVLLSNPDPMTSLAPDLRVLRVRSDGTLAAGFPDSGLVVCAGPGVRYSPTFVPDGRGGVYAVWLDTRNYSYQGEYDVFATRIGPDGNALANVTPPPPPAGQALVATPNPFTSVVSFELSAGGHHNSPLDIFDAAGRRVRTLASGAGSGRVQWNGLDDAGRAVPPGLYLVRTHAGVSVRVVRVL